MVTMARKKRLASKGQRLRKPAGGRAASPQMHDLPELQRARRFWHEKQYDRALNAFDDAVRKHPRNLAALTDAARAFGARFELAKAESLLDRMIELAPRQSEVLFLAGQSYRMVHRPEKAVAVLRRAVAGGDHVPDAYLELAVLCERRNELEESQNTIDALLRLEPNYAEARLVKAALQARRAQYEQADALLESVVKNMDVHWLSRARAWSQRGQLLDKQERYDDAMAAVLQAKRILTGHNEQLSDTVDDERRHHEHLLAEVTADHLHQWREQVASFEPKRVALLTGSPRSGTTLLEKVLDSHPDVISSDEREAFPRFVLPMMYQDSGMQGDILSTSWLSDIPNDRLLSHRHRYLNFMESALGERIGERMHVDKNPSLPPSLPNVLRLFPECRVIVALRDPRDVILSCFMTHMPVNRATVSYFTLAGAAKRYAYEMNAWLKMRSIMDSTWIESRYEDMVQNQPTEAKRVIQSLGLPWNDAVLGYREHLKTRQTDSPTYADVAKPLYTSSIGRWKNYEKYFGEVLDTLEPFIKEFGYD